MAYKMAEPGWFEDVNGIRVVHHPLPDRQGDFALSDAGQFVAHHGIEWHRQQGDGNDISGTQISRGYPICTFSIGNDGTINQYCHMFEYAPWHGDSVSQYAYGIEHAGFTGKPATVGQLRSSHALCAALVEITEDRFGEVIPFVWVADVNVGNYRSVKGFWNHRAVQRGPLNETGHSDLLEGESTSAFLRATKALLVPQKPAPAFPGVLLKRGVTDAGVITWKRRMASKGLFTLLGQNDGPFFGAGIEDSTRRFQQRKRLDQDGIVGPKTWEAAW
jgi:hypothetical protein